MNNLKQPSVGTCTIHDFFQNGREAKIPEYQRPYVWQEVKLEQLIEDLEAHFLFTKDKQEVFNNQKENYYLGTVLLCEKNGEYEIIDGQQRITTLLLLDYAWRKNESIISNHQWDLTYTSLISKKNIKTNVALLENWSTKIKPFLTTIFSKLVITLIVTTSEDEAFTFFDSQNNRGVPLSSVDFLKSYHLRALGGNEDLQKIFASKWDSNNKGQFLGQIFRFILWRNRNWKGTNPWYGGNNRDAVLYTFQKESIKPLRSDEVQLYPNTFNTLSGSLEYNSQTGISIQPNRLNIQASPVDYPFAIRQPIEHGTGFFLYSEKYHAIYEMLFINFRFQDLKECYKNLYREVSIYLKRFFELAVVSYYDKHQDYKLLEFALWLDYLLGSYRMNQHSIVAQTIIKILRDHRQNLLDVIEMSYRPETVFEFLKNSTNDSHYAKANDEKINNIRKKYKQNNLDYYQNVRTNRDLTNKKEWINAKLTQ